MRRHRAPASADDRSAAPSASADELTRKFSLRQLGKQLSQIYFQISRRQNAYPLRPTAGVILPAGSLLRVDNLAVRHSPSVALLAFFQRGAKPALGR